MFPFRRYRRNCSAKAAMFVIFFSVPVGGGLIHQRKIRGQRFIRGSHGSTERAQFFAVAAQMMRRILVDAARTRGAHKRGGNALKVNLDETAILSKAPDRSILALDEALTAFSQVAPRQARVVELRYFGGLTEEEIVATLNISPRTVRRDWDLARAWLLRELKH